MPSRRHQRFHDVIGQRLGHVRCAIESVHHRHNVSAMLRTCDALGIHTVHLVGIDRFKAVRGAARGAERWLDLRLEADAATAMESLRRDGYQIWVADLHDDSRAPETVPVEAPTCLWFGGEHVGVSEHARNAADGVLTIPMQGFAQSLNVSVAAAMALHTVCTRARSLHGDAALLPPDLQRSVVQGWKSRDVELGIGIANLAEVAE